MEILKSDVGKAAYKEQKIAEAKAAAEAKAQESNG